MPDIAIIGAGLAGLSAAKTLSCYNNHFSTIDIYEAGPHFGRRFCHFNTTRNICMQCNKCTFLQGVGGAATINGGKLCHYPAGSGLFDFDNNDDIINHLINCDSLLQISNNTKISSVIPYYYQYKEYNSTIYYKSDIKELILYYLSCLSNKVKLLTSHTVSNIHRERKSWVLDITSIDNTIISRNYDFVIYATGRSNIESTKILFNNINIEYDEQAVDLGIRLEFPISHHSHIPFGAIDPKIKYIIDNNSDVRTFCMNWGGTLAINKAFNGINVDGNFSDKATNMANIAIMHRKYYGCFDHVIMTKRFIASLSKGNIPFTQNFIGFYHGVNRDDKQYKPSISAVNARIDKLLDNDSYNYIKMLSMDFLKCYSIPLESVRVYSPAIDRYWPHIQCDKYGECSMQNFYVAGDIRGWSRGYTQAIWSGYLSAFGILNKIGIELMENEVQEA